ncbi:MAG: hypothetical protein PHZ23_14575 [Acidiphilium sp.]|nr:hypothetical protein [Acidiphilium sp.]
MADGSIAHPALDAKPEPTIQQHRAWECVNEMLSFYIHRIGDDDIVKLIDLAWIEPGDFSEQDIDDAMLAFETYVEKRT